MCAFFSLDVSPKMFRLIIIKTGVKGLHDPTGQKRYLQGILQIAWTCCTPAAVIICAEMTDLCWDFELLNHSELKEHANAGFDEVKL